MDVPLPEDLADDPIAQSFEPSDLTTRASALAI